jgi:short-subunit dehydrogenase
MSRRLALITGTTSGIGEAIARRLLTTNFRVIGISRRPGTIEHDAYEHLQVDLADSAALTLAAEKILERKNPLDVLINNAGVGHFAPHEELSCTHIEEMVRINLLAPMLLSKLCLRAIKSSRGWIINISSFSAHERSSFGAAYAATKAGIKHFSDSLFEEVRKSGAKVVTISPDITRTPFYDDLSFAPEDDPAAAVQPEDVAETVLHVLSQREGSIISEVVIRPQRLLLQKRKRTAS